MDGSVLVSGDGTALINRLTNNVDDSSECFGTDGDHNGVAGIDDLLTTNETLSGVQGDSAHIVSTQMLRNLEDETRGSTLHLKGVENGRQGTLELDVDDSTDNLRNFSSSNSVS